MGRAERSRRARAPPRRARGDPHHAHRSRNLRRVGRREHHRKRLHPALRVGNQGDAQRQPRGPEASPAARRRRRPDRAGPESVRPHAPAPGPQAEPEPPIRVDARGGATPPSAPAAPDRGDRGRRRPRRPTQSQPRRRPAATPAPRPSGSRAARSPRAAAESPAIASARAAVVEADGRAARAGCFARVFRRMRPRQPEPAPPARWRASRRSRSPWRARPRARSRAVERRPFAAVETLARASSRPPRSIEPEWRPPRRPRPSRSQTPRRRLSRSPPRGEATPPADEPRGGHLSGARRGGGRLRRGGHGGAHRRARPPRRRITARSPRASAAGAARASTADRVRRRRSARSELTLGPRATPPRPRRRLTRGRGSRSSDLEPPEPGAASATDRGPDGEASRPVSATAALEAAARGSLDGPHAALAARAPPPERGRRRRHPRTDGRARPARGARVSRRLASSERTRVHSTPC